MMPLRNGSFMHDGNNRGSNVVLGSTQTFGGDSNIGNNGIHVTFIQHVTRPASTSPSLDDISEEESDSRSNSPGGSTVSTQGFQSEDGRRVISRGRLRRENANEKKSERNICEDITTPRPFNPRLRQYEREANTNLPDRKAIAATNWPERNVRIYFQDLSNNIREAFQTGQNPGKWHLTPSHIGINDAKRGTALAVISRRNGSEIRLYYISEINTIHEWCFFEGQGWSRGTLNDSATFVLPGSQLAAVASARVIHVYYQSLDGVINEYSSLDTEPGWKHAKTHALALRGSAIAATAFPGRDALEVHLYYQREDLAVREYLRVGNSWKLGEFHELKAKIYTTLAALSWESRTTQIRVYCRSDSGKLVELQYDGDEWEESEDELVALNSIADDAQLAVIQREMSGSSALQAYFVSGKKEIGEVLCNTSTKWLLPIEKFTF